MDVETIMKILFVIGVLWFFAALSSRKESDNIDTSTWSTEGPESELERKRREVEERITDAEYKTKVSILMKLKMDHLKTICAVENLSCPSTKRKEDLAKYLAWQLSLEEVKNWAWRYKVASKDEIRAFREVEKSLWEEFEEFKAERLKKANINVEDSEDNYSFDYDKLGEEFYEKEDGSDDYDSDYDILNILEDFQPETVRDEEDLEKQLYQYLRARLGSEVQRQVPVGDQKVDIVIGGRIGIEIKIAESRSKLQRLVGQVLDYVEYFDEVIAVILDVKANVDIDRYIEKLRMLGAEVVVLEGDIRRKGKSREIIIQDARRKVIIR